MCCFFVGDTATPREGFQNGHFSYSRIHCVVVGFDVTSEYTFTDLGKMISYLERLLPDEGMIVGVGNKIDLADQREVSTEAARAFFESLEPPVPYVEVSAKTGEGIDELQNLIVYTVMKRWAAKQGRNFNDNDDKDSKHKKKKKKGKGKDGGCIVC